MDATEFTMTIAAGRTQQIKDIDLFFFVSHRVLPSSRAQEIDNDENNECRTDAGAKQRLHQGVRHRP